MSESTNSTLGKRPAPFEPPRQRAKRRKGLNAMSDLAVWDYSDQEIIDALQTTWRSAVYAHYVPVLERQYDPSTGEPQCMMVRFECKYQSPDHPTPTRERLRSNDGTTNLWTSAQTCDARRGVITPNNGEEAEMAYLEANHRAILAIRCARDRRSFDSVVGDLHRREVQLLRPGTVLPSASTVSRDVKNVYFDAATGVSRHLRHVPGAIHLAIDGWTCPTSESYLGVIAFWHERGQIWRVILEFVRLTESHTGNYMGERVHNCLKRFGIEKKIGSICLDNAASNNTLVSQLQSLIPSFRGPNSRVRCFAHIMNLMAKSFMSLFSPAPCQSTGLSASNVEQAARASDDPVGDPGDSLVELDLDKLQHDRGVVQGITAKAISIMADSGMHITDEELEMARGILPKVAGLARRVNDSPTLVDLFEKTVDRDPDLQGDSRALTRRNATRWHTDRAALNSHLHFKPAVRWLTGARQSLNKYALTDAQWSLAAELSSVLEIFQEPTNRFSQSEVPLIHETLPELLSLRARLYDVRDDLLKQNLHLVTRVAAEAALLVFEKYMGAIEESDVYELAVVLCPDRKLVWFSDRGYDVARIRARVVDRFAALYPTENQGANTVPNNIPSSSTNSQNIWTQRHSPLSSPPTNFEQDTIEAYLDSPVVPRDIITQNGGVLSYWGSRLEGRPRVARMALDYLTVPASSVDAERAFSGGRLMINHLQHQMSAQTFQAQMAVGSWCDTPLLPSLEEVSDIIKSHM